MDFYSFLLSIYWNPSKNLFTIPYLEHPIAWYGIFFVMGLAVSYLFMLYFFREFLLETYNEKINVLKVSWELADRLCWMIIIGTILGARLGHIFFYESSYYLEKPFRILEIWKGGLASHGAVIGIIVAVISFRYWVRNRFPTLTILRLMDMLVIPAGIAGSLIRIGNFFNQELIGTFSSAPWAVIFGSPADGSSPLPRHPVQLYESIAYLLTFFILSIFYLQGFKKRTGLLTGLFFIFVFLARFILEFYKEMVPSSFFSHFSLQAGQVLSIPYILLGTLLIFFAFRKNKTISIQKNFQ